MRNCATGVSSLFLYTYEDGEWKIAHHHSSVMPEGMLAAAAAASEKKTTKSKGKIRA